MHLFYNALPFDTLMVELKDVETTDTKIYDHLVVLYHQEHIIGYNILKASKVLSKPLRIGLNDVTYDLIHQVNQLLEQYQLPLLTLDIPRHFVVGHVLSKEAVEGSDKLSVLKVDIGSEALQIVCGASNVDVNQHVVVALVGAKMPSGLKIVPSKLKGIESNGMICSARELAIESLSSAPGILVLDDSYEVGKIYER